MSDTWRRLRLGAVLRLDIDSVPVDPDATYEVAGVYNRGRGLFRRDDLPGRDTSYKTLHRLGKSQLVMSKLKAWEGSVAVVPAELDGVHASPEFPTFTCEPDLEPTFLHYVCQQPQFWASMQDEARGMGGRRERVHPRRLLDVELDLPPVREQQEITAALLRADDYLAGLRHLADAASAVARAHRRDTFGSPSSSVPVSEVADVTMGRQRSPQHRQGEHMTPYLRAANVKNGRLDLSDVQLMNFTPKEREVFALLPGDVLVTEGAGSSAAVGAAATFTGEVPAPVCFQNTLLRFRARAGRASPGILTHWCRWAYESGTFADAASGTNILHIGSTRAQKLPFPALDGPAQEAALCRLDAAQAYADAANLTHEQFTIARRALMRDLLRPPEERGGALIDLAESA